MNRLIKDAALHAKWTNLKVELQKISAHLIGSPVIGKMLVNYWGRPREAGANRISAALQAVGLQNRVSVNRVVNSGYYELLHGRRALRPYEVEARKRQRGKSRKQKTYRNKGNTKRVGNAK